jgi:RHS repeat-associated protein
LVTRTAAGVRRSLTRDSTGRITAYTHANNGTPVPALDQAFSYDNLNRLTSASLGASSIQYSYDATGNRASKAISGTSYPNTIAPTSNKLTQTQDVLGTATVQHDAAGNITSDGTNTYTYSDRGRLATMSNAGGTVTYSYNALEQRVAKTGPTALVPTGATYYVYDEAGKLLGEYDANGVPIYETIYLSIPVGVIKQTGTAAASDIAISLYNVSTDQIGAPRVITRSSDEAIVWRWDSAEAFGATAPDQNPNNLGTFTFNQRLPGQVFDAESGLFQNWNRELNARLGRYIQSDPIGLEGGINTFSYVDNNPLSLVDVEGLQGRPEPGSGFARRAYEEQGAKFRNPNYWGRQDTLDRHFRDHGKDFGSKNPAQYAEQTREFFRQSQMNRWPTKIDKDGIIRCYDPKTNTFGAYNPDGTSRTMFKPNSPTYWDRQPGKSPWEPK